MEYLSFLEKGYLQDSEIQMEKAEYPPSLIYPDAEIRIYYEEKIQVNKTHTAIIIEGNRTGFLSLSSLINVYTVYLYQEIIITEFPFVKASIKLVLIEKTDQLLRDGHIIQEPVDYFKWRISETNIFGLIAMMHSLGYANQELHLDSGLEFEDISVYCVVA